MLRNLSLLKFFAPVDAGASSAAASTAASAAAAATTATQTPAEAAKPAVQQDFDLENLSPNSKEYRDWQSTGKLPKKVSSEKAASTTAEEEELDESETAEDEDSPTSAAETAAEAQPANNRPQKGKRSEHRYHELVDLIQQKDRELAELRKPKEAAESTAKAQPAAKEVPEPGMDDKDETGKAKYPTMVEYMKARDAWLTEKLVGTIDQRTEQRQRERMSQEQAREVNDRFRNRLDKAREKYEDFDKVAMSKDLPIPHGSTMESAIVLSEHGAEMSYLLGKDPKEAARIAKLNPYEQAREMFLVELLAGGWESLAKDPRFTPKITAAPAKVKITAANRPAIEIGGAGQVLPDEEEQAAKESDSDPQAVRRYIDAANRRAIEKRKGR